MNTALELEKYLSACSERAWAATWIKTASHFLFSKFAAGGGQIYGFRWGRSSLALPRRPFLRFPRRQLAAKLF